MSKLTFAERPKHYIITETNAPTSFDPLDADKTENLPAARMLYLTPIEMSTGDKLASSALEFFHYDEKNKKIVLMVRPGLFFNNGVPITADDIAFSIARMAYARPQFPVIQHIDGLEVWRKKTLALKSYPDGIRIQGHRIEIHLTHHVAHPLSRLCLELFSIIPRSSVDPLTNKLKIGRPPESGYYQLRHQNVDEWVFIKRKDVFVTTTKQIPDKIIFQFIHPKKAVLRAKTIDNDTVISTNEGLYSPSELDEITQNNAVYAAPSSRFGAILLNPNVASFKKRECRQLFADTFREKIKALFAGGLQQEASLFTKIMPGYLSTTELKKKRPQDGARCADTLKKTIFKWGTVKGNSNFYFELAMKQTIASLQISEVHFFEFQSKEDMYKSFVDGAIGATFAASGFWPIDPAGDLQMLFTPNLHKVLTFVSKNKSLQKRIQEIQREVDPLRRKGLFEQINNDIYNDALFNVYVHFRRFFVSHKSHSLKTIPIAITSTAPWQVFGGNGQ